MVPEPRGPEYETLDTSAFFSTPKPKAFIFETADRSLSADPRSWLLFSDRVAASNNAQVPYQVCSRNLFICRRLRMWHMLLLSCCNQDRRHH
jgi:hypothetical protein